MLPHEGWFVCNQFFIISYEHCSWLFGWSLYHCLLPRAILLYLVWGRGRFRSDGGHGSCKYSSPQIFSNFEPSESGFEPSESGLNLLRVVLSLLRVVLSLLRVVLRHQELGSYGVTDRFLVNKSHYCIFSWQNFGGKSSPAQQIEHIDSSCRNKG